MTMTALLPERNGTGEFIIDDFASCQSWLNIQNHFFKLITACQKVNEKYYIVRTSSSSVAAVMMYWFHYVNFFVADYLVWWNSPKIYMRHIEFRNHNYYYFDCPKFHRRIRGLGTHASFTIPTSILHHPSCALFCFRSFRFVLENK